MVKKKRFMAGFALLPAVMIILFFTSTVATFFLIIYQKTRQVENYAGQVAAKWVARGGIHIAEEIIRNSSCVGCYTKAATLEGSNVAPSLGVQNDLPEATAAYSITATDQGYYDVQFSPPMASSKIESLCIYLAGSLGSRDLYVKSSCDTRYKTLPFKYEVDVHYRKSYLSDFFYYQDSGQNHIHHLPVVMDCGESMGIHINGFWNIMPAWGWNYETSQIINTQNIEVSGYIRVLSRTGPGTNDAETDFAPWPWGYDPGYDPEWVRSTQIEDPNNPGTFVTLPKDLFRFRDPQTGRSYENYDFVEELPEDYARDLAYWNQWRTENNVGTFLRDSLMGVQDFSFSSMPTGQEMVTILSNRSNVKFVAASGGSPLDKVTDLASQINSHYQAQEPIAKPRVMVNLYRGDRRDYVVEIDVGKLVSSPSYNTESNNIYLGPAVGNSADIEKLAVLLKNAEDVGNIDLAFVVEGAVYTHGSVNSAKPEEQRPTMVIAARDDHYVLSENFDLSRVYLGSGDDESKYTEYNEQYIAQKLPIVNPEYAEYINRTVDGNVEKPLTPAQIVADPDKGKNGQYWIYDDAGNPTHQVNTGYGKIVNTASDTTLNFAVINRYVPLAQMEYWNTGYWGIPGEPVNLAYTGTLGCIRALGHPQYYRGNLWYDRAERTWWARTNGSDMGVGSTYYSASHAEGDDAVKYFNVGVFGGTANRTENYDANFINHPPPITFDVAIRQTWSEKTIYVPLNP